MGMVVSGMAMDQQVNAPAAVSKTGSSEELQTGSDNNLFRALSGGRITFNNRFRVELVTQDGLDDARALTNRLQLGYGTRPYHGFSGYVDFVDVRPIGPANYNAAGLNNKPGHAVVADPRLTVLNQLYGQFRDESFGFMLRVGRQRIIHHSSRFIGNVGWRQNEQTFDALTANSSFGVENLNLEYSYIWQVNRIQGPDHPMGIFTSDSHLAHLIYDDLIPGSRFTGFYYYLDFDEVPLFATQTYGVRLNGSFSMGEDLSVQYAGSFALQESAGENPVNYSAAYYMADLSVGKTGRVRAGAAWEVLGSDNGDAAFQTPLATLHAVQGWADLFLNTPPDGLEDFSVYATATLPWDVNATARHHWFHSNEMDDQYGREWNFSVGKRFTPNLSFLLKFADFRSESTLPDSRKFWLQMEIAF